MTEDNRMQFYTNIWLNFEFSIFSDCHNAWHIQKVNTESTSIRFHCMHHWRNGKKRQDAIVYKYMAKYEFSTFRGNVKKNSIFVDIVQIEVDLPPSYLIFDKFNFDILLIMLTSLSPLEFLTKIIKFQALKL